MPSRTPMITHLQFRRDIARYLVKAEARLRLGGPRAQPSTSVRYDRVNHTLISVSQGRCVVCKKQGASM